MNGFVRDDEVVGSRGLRSTAELPIMSAQVAIAISVGVLVALVLGTVGVGRLLQTSVNGDDDQQLGGDFGRVVRTLGGSLEARYRLYVESRPQPANIPVTIVPGQRVDSEARWGLNDVDAEPDGIVVLDVSGRLDGDTLTAPLPGDQARRLLRCGHLVVVVNRSAAAGVLSALRSLAVC